MKRTYEKHRCTRSIVNGVRFWLVLVILVSSIGPMLVSADVVWFDNFNDLNYDGWTVSGGTWTCSEGYLECTGDVEPLFPGCICHESNTLKGTWSFDCYLPLNWLFVMLMGEGAELDGEATYGLIIQFRMMGIEIFRGRWAEETLLLTYTSDAFFKETWTHIDVTVDEEANIDVFVNNTHRIHYQTLSFDYENIHFKCGCGEVDAAIDNIFVSDTIDYESLPFNFTPTTPTTTTPTTTTPTTTTPTTTTPTTTTTTTPTNGGFDMTMILLVGGGIAAIVVIVLVVWKVRE